MVNENFICDSTQLFRNIKQNKQKSVMINIQIKFGKIETQFYYHNTYSIIKQNFQLLIQAIEIMDTSSIDQFRARAQKLSSKLQQTLQQSSQQQAQKHQAALKQLQICQKNADATHTNKLAIYSNLMEKVSSLSQEVQEQKKEGAKAELKIKNKIEMANRNLEMMLQKLRKQREIFEEEIKQFLECKVNELVDKNGRNRWEDSEQNISFEDEIKELKQMQKDIQKFFTDGIAQQNQLRQHLLLSLDNYRQYLRREDEKTFLNEIKGYLGEVHQDICLKIDEMRRKREVMEEEMLNLLEKMFEFTNSGKKDHGVVGW